MIDLKEKTRRVGQIKIGDIFILKEKSRNDDFYKILFCRYSDWKSYNPTGKIKIVDIEFYKEPYVKVKILRENEVMHALMSLRMLKEEFNICNK